MNKVNKNKAHKNNFMVKGIIHCHTNHSYDSQLRLSDLCATLRRKGFHFVALTEHSKGMTSKKYEEFLTACQKENKETFMVIPGLEVRCDDGTEIAGIGVNQLISHGSANQVITQIHELGGFALWVHPLKHRSNYGHFLQCNAFEVLNGKMDGVVAPNFSLIRRVKKYRRIGYIIFALFGLDLHSYQENFPVWTECNVSDLTPQAIVYSLSKGFFVNRLKKGVVHSSGEIPPLDFLYLLVLRFLYLFWNRLLLLMPDSLSTLVIRLSRPMVRVIKQGN